jgi:hypothetical protein
VALAEPAVQVVREALVALAEPAVQVVREALAELAALAVRGAPAGLVVQVVQLELNRVAGLELVQVEAELARGQVEAVPERDPVAVPPRIKLVIAVRHRDLVPRLVAVEGSAAVVETTRAPAAIEAVIAWAAAV